MTTQDPEKSDNFDRLLTHRAQIAEFVNSFTSDRVQRKAFEAIVCSLGLSSRSAATPTPRSRTPRRSVSSGCPGDGGLGRDARRARQRRRRHPGVGWTSPPVGQVRHQEVVHGSSWAQLRAGGEADAGGLHCGEAAAQQRREEPRRLLLPQRDDGDRRGRRRGRPRGLSGRGVGRTRPAGHGAPKTASNTGWIDTANMQVDQGRLEGRELPRDQDAGRAEEEVQLR